jgi:hypothetical protein
MTDEQVDKALQDVTDLAQHTADRLDHLFIWVGITAILIGFLVCLCVYILILARREADAREARNFEYPPFTVPVDFDDAVPTFRHGGFVTGGEATEMSFKRATDMFRSGSGSGSIQS